jgi:hypothetical protein
VQVDENAGPEIARFQVAAASARCACIPDVSAARLGTQLLDAAEAHLRAHGSPLSTLYFPHHLLPGIPADAKRPFVVRKRGYTGFHECVDLWRDLNDYEIPAKARAAIEANPTVELRPRTRTKKEALIAWWSASFPAAGPTRRVAFRARRRSERHHHRVEK